MTSGQERTGWQSDFSLILQGEDKPKEMLDIFISEGRKKLFRLHAAQKEVTGKPSMQSLRRIYNTW